MDAKGFLLFVIVIAIELRPVITRFEKKLKLYMISKLSLKFV